MPDTPEYIYWDANVFLDYINGSEPIATTIADLLSNIEDSNGAKRIVTSTLSKVEVAYAAVEKTGRTLDAGIEAQIDQLWNDISVIELIEFHDEIALEARSLLREAMVKRRRLLPPDAIHLASAVWIGAQEIHTSDSILWTHRDIVGMNICAPYVEQSRMHAEGFE